MEPALAKHDASGAVRDFDSVAPGQGDPFGLLLDLRCCVASVTFRPDKPLCNTGPTQRKRETALSAISLPAMNPSVPQHQAKAVNTVLKSIPKCKLLPQKVIKLLPPLGSTDGQIDPIAIVRFFMPDSPWAWYATEFDGRDTVFGFVDGDARVFQHFSLRQLVGARDHLGLPIERDRAFRPTPLSQIS